MGKVQVKRFYAGMRGLSASLPTAGNGVIKQLEACLVTGFNINQVASLAVAGGVVTVNTNSSHGYNVGDVVEISVDGGHAVAGEYCVVSALANSFTVRAAGVSDTSITQGISVKIAPAGWDLIESVGNARAFRAKPSVGHLAGNNPTYVIDEPSDYYITQQGFLSYESMSVKSGAFPASAAVNSRTVNGDLLEIVASDRFCWVFTNWWRAGEIMMFCFGRFSDDAWGSLINGGGKGLSFEGAGAMHACNDFNNPEWNKWCPLGPSSVSPVPFSTIGMTNKDILSTDAPYPHPDRAGEAVFSAAFIYVQGAMRRAPGLFVAHHKETSVPASSVMPDGRQIRHYRIAHSQRGAGINSLFLDVTGPWHE